MTMLSIQTLTKLYDGIPVVDDVSLEIPKGKVTSLIGPNGAGKSTVLGIAARLLAAEHGDVLFDGRSIKSWNTRALARRLAVLTQTNTVQMKVTVRELVGFGRFPHSGTRLTDDDRRRVDELGKTVILVLHEINLASFYSDRICAFKDGRLAFSGTPAEVMTEERLRAVYGVDFRIVEVDGRPMALYH